MPTKLQLRRGNTATTLETTACSGELFVNTDTNDLHLHDGTTPGGHKIGAGADSLGNFKVGTDALTNNATGTNNIAVGTNALKENTYGENNVAQGYGSLSNALGSKNNVAMGYQSLNCTTGLPHWAIINPGYGYNYGGTTEINSQWGQGLQTSYVCGPEVTGCYKFGGCIVDGCISSIFVTDCSTGSGANLGTLITTYGCSYGTATSGGNPRACFLIDCIAYPSNNIALGYKTLYGSSGSNNIAQGYRAGEGNKGDYTIALGCKALYLNCSPHNMAIGNNALGGNNQGYCADYGGNYGCYNLAIGDNAYSLALWGYGCNVAIGYNANLCGVTGYGTFIGYSAGACVCQDYGSVAIGYKSNGNAQYGYGNTTLGTCSMQCGYGMNNMIMVGYGTGEHATYGENSIAIGGGETYRCVQGTGWNDQIRNNVAIGQGVFTGGAGYGSIALGAYTLQSSHTSMYDIAIGFNALVNGSIDENRAKGCASYLSCCTLNIAIGKEALGSTYTAILGRQNIAIGTQAGGFAVNSQCGIFIGACAGKQIGMCGRPTALSRGVIALGAGSMQNSLNANNSIGIGANTLFSSSGNDNIAQGYNSLRGNLAGNDNIAIGSNALKTNHYLNTFVSCGGGSSYNPGTYTAQCLQAVGTQPSVPLCADIVVNAQGCVESISNFVGGTGADLDTSFQVPNGSPLGYGWGFYAVPTFGSANTNIAIGSSALCNNGGDNNIAIGYNAGSNNLRGAMNIIIGHCAQASSNTTNNQITIGTSSYTCQRAPSATWTSLSDQRDKTCVQPINVGLNFVKELNPVKFNWKIRNTDETHPRWMMPDSGFLAQDLLELVNKYTNSQGYDVKGHLRLASDSNPDEIMADPGKLIPVLVKAIQELTARVEALEAK